VVGASVGARVWRSVLPAAAIAAGLVLPASGGWRVEPTPTVANDPASLYAVSCTSVTWCMAVGALSARTGRADRWTPLVEHWSGAAWTRMRLPAAASPSALQSVSCVSTSFCVAVGGSTSAGLVATWNGKSWTMHSLGDTLLYAVTCVSRAWCKAAGSETNILKGRLPILTWDRERWGTTIDDAPPNAVITGIDCPTEHVCVAVGSKPSQNEPASLAQVWEGDRWREIPVRHGAATELSAVDCVTRVHCVAVGNTTSVPYRSFIEEWDGGSWTGMKSPDNPRLTDNLLHSVSCPTAGRCVAVGWAEDPAQAHEAPLIESLHAGRWVMISNPRTGDARLWGVWCAGTGHCRATGDRGLPTYRTFAESGSP